MDMSIERISPHFATENSNLCRSLVLKQSKKKLNLSLRGKYLHITPQTKSFIKNI